MLKCLLTDGGGVMNVTHDQVRQSLTVRVDRAKICTHGKPALGKVLLPACICTCFDAQPTLEVAARTMRSCRGWTGETVLAKKPPPLGLVHANTFLDGDAVTLLEYEPTVEGVIES